jgi:RNA polymerase-binding transcription factor DksA
VTTEDLTRTVAPITPAQLTQLRSALHEQRAFRLEQLAELEATAGPNDDDTALESAARAALADIEAALGRITDGRYGVCVRCGRAIPAERLEVVPSAALCMGCQSAAERSRA